MNVMRLTMITTTHLLYEALLEADPLKSLRRAVIILIADGYDKHTILEMLEVAQQAENDPVKRSCIIEIMAYLDHLPIAK